MIQAHIDNNDELIVAGEVVEGDRYPDLCCTGYDFVIAVVIVSAWGHCENPEHYVDDELYSDSFAIEDIALFLAERNMEVIA